MAGFDLSQFTADARKLRNGCRMICGATVYSPYNTQKVEHEYRMIYAGFPSLFVGVGIGSQVHTLACIVLEPIQNVDPPLLDSTTPPSP